MLRKPILWREERLSDLSAVSFETLTESFRDDSVIVGVVLDLEKLKGKSIVLLSPKQTAFCQPLLSKCAMSCAPAFNGAVREKGEGLAKRYNAQLRLFGIKKTDPQVRLLGDFNEAFGRHGDAWKSLSVSAMYADELRWFSIGVFNETSEPVRHFLDRWFEQLGDYAIVPFPEQKPVTDRTGNPLDPAKYGFAHWLMTWSVAVFWLGGADANDAISGRVLSKLHALVNSLENGEVVDLELDPQDQVLRPIAVTCDRNISHPSTADILSWRARLIRLLQDPRYLPSVEVQLPNLRSEWNALAGESGTLYSPILELDLFISEMLLRFPVLSETPLLTQYSPD